MDQDRFYAEHLQWRQLETEVVNPDLPHWFRRRAQRALRQEQRAIVAELDRYRDADGKPYSGQEWSRYRDSKGWLGVDRYIHSCLGRARRTRAAPPHTPWGRLLEGWTPDKRCAHAFAVDAQGQVVHHDDPAAARWCLGGWLAHLCQKPDPGNARPHRAQTEAERSTREWVARIDDREARRLLDEVWALVPARTRAVVERIWKERLPKAADRKRIEFHPLGFWWFLAPHLAERFLQLPPSPETAPETQRVPG